MTREELKVLVKENIKDLPDVVFDDLEEFMDYTLEGNEKFNLTAIKDKDVFRELMIYDSLLPIKYFDFENKKVLDVGTGAGYPGVPLLLSTKGNFTLLDSTNKKIDHINNYLSTKNKNNGFAQCFRAENYVKEHREEYDFAIARALASLSILVELCIPALKVGGYLLAMKSIKVEEEINQAHNAIKKLDCEVVGQYEDYLPLSNERRILLVIRKNKPSKKIYPRDYSIIKSQPL